MRRKSDEYVHFVVRKKYFWTVVIGAVYLFMMWWVNNPAAYIEKCPVVVSSIASILLTLVFLLFVGGIWGGWCD